MIIEALINLADIGNEKNYFPGDILVIRPIDSFWGIGDLQTRIVVRINMPDFPCGVDFFINRKCAKCEHHGIIWPVTALIDGTTGTPKVSCIKEQYEAEDITFTFSFNYQGIPILNANMQKRRMGKLLLDTIISAGELATILSETSITEIERDARLAFYRDPARLITLDKLEVKTIK